MFSSLLLIFFVHGLVYAILLFRKSYVQATRSDKWLGYFLLLCVLYICPWMVGFAGWYDNQPYRDLLFYIPFQHLYFMGPVIFFYVQSQLNPSFRFGKRECWHLLPGILYIVFSGVMFVTDKLVLRRYFFLASETDSDFDTWYQLTGLLSMLFYFILSIRYYSLYWKLMVQVISYADVVMFRWIRNFLFAFLLMMVVRAGFYIISSFLTDNYANSWWYFLVFAIIFYYIAIAGYSNSIETKIAFRPNLLSYRPQLLLHYQPTAIPGTLTEEVEFIELNTAMEEKQGDEALLEEWKQKIWALMEQQRAYEDPELSLTGVSRQLGTNPALISRMINAGFHLNFNDFVNQFRVEAIKRMIEKGEHRNQTLLGMAYDSGFNSKATFNRAFKKATGVSPRQWMEEHHPI